MRVLLVTGGFLLVLAMVIGVAALPAMRIVLGPQPAFLGPYGSVLVATEVLAALFLFWRAQATGSRRAAWLSAAYAFSAPLVIGNVITLPGVLFPAGTFGFETPPWLWAMWHLGWSIVIVIYAWSEDGPVKRLAVFPAVAVVVALVCVAIGLRADTLLPPVIGHGVERYSPALSILGWWAVALLAIAGGGLFRRARSQLDPWVFVAVVVLACDVTLVLTTSVRFSIGSYVARVLGALNGLTLFVAVAIEYGSLVRTRASMDAMRDVVDQIPALAWTANADGWIDWYNQRWYAYTGQRPEDAAGWGWQDVHHPEDLPEVMRRWPESIRTGEPFEMQFRLRGADGTFRWFLTRVEPFRDASNRIVRWYGTNVDIDVREQAALHDRAIVEAFTREFLPASLPTVEGARFSALYRAAARDGEVGGDWYDVLALEDRRILVTIGDVSGHGLEAATRMIRVREALRAAAFLHVADPAAILRFAQRVAHDGGLLATALVAIIDPVGRRMTYSCAGHPPPLLVRANTIVELLPGGIPLGIDPALADELSASHVVDVAADDAIVFYTDGLIESQRDTLASTERLHALLTGGMRAPSDLVSAVVGADQRDDIAIVLVELFGVADGAALPVLQS